MDKRGTWFFRLVAALFALTLTAYAAAALCAGESEYRLQSAQACEVGDGISVSGFVVRSEQRLTSTAPTLSTLREGQRVSGGQALANTEQGTIWSTQAGYFSHVSDGYEALLTPQFVQTASLRELDSLVPEPCGDAYGRLIVGQTWYFVSACPERAPKLGTRVEIRIADLSCTAEVLRADELLLLRCNEALQHLTTPRSVEIWLCLDSYRGLRVPKQAIYYEAGHSFVYILQGARLRQKEIEILCHDGEDVLVQGELPEGAQVVVTQIELREGMVLP